VVAAVLLALLLVAVYVIVRSTSLSAVEDVTIVGVEGPRASETRKTLEQAATGQSTLGFDVEALRDAVDQMPSITGVDAHARFPHGVQIEVHQRVAVGALSVDGRKVAVATDGTLLPEWDAADLPIVNGGRASGGRLVTEHRNAARVLAAAPEPLAAKIARIDKTTIVRLSNGPALLFRDGHRLAAKWMAVTAVLADPSSVGATWIDLRVPERPVAGRGAPPPLPDRDEPARDLHAGSPKASTANASAASDAITEPSAAVASGTADSPAGEVAAAESTTLAASQEQP
jgi:cell division protein FtsQ